MPCACCFRMFTGRASTSYRFWVLRPPIMWKGPGKALFGARAGSEERKASYNAKNDTAIPACGTPPKPVSQNTTPAQRTPPAVVASAQFSMPENASTRTAAKQPGMFSPPRSAPQEQAAAPPTPPATAAAAGAAAPAATHKQQWQLTPAETKRAEHKASLMRFKLNTPPPASVENTGIYSDRTSNRKYSVGCAPAHATAHPHLALHPWLSPRSLTACAAAPTRRVCTVRVISTAAQYCRAQLVAGPTGVRRSRPSEEGQ